MSACEVYAITKTGKVRWYGDAKNSFGGGFHIWQSLNKKYSFEQGSVIPAFEPLWKATPSLDMRDQWVLMSTFDMVYILKKYLPTLIEHMISFEQEYPSTTLEREIALLQEIMQDTRYIGACWNQTSVNDNPWQVYKKGKTIEDDGGRRPLNIFRDVDKVDFYEMPSTGMLEAVSAVK